MFFSQRKHQWMIERAMAILCSKFGIIHARDARVTFARFGHLKVTDKAFFHAL